MFSVRYNESADSKEGSENMSVFTQLYKSLYSPKDMARFRFQKIGKTILYILLLAVLSTIPESFQIGRMMKEQFSILEQTINSEIPEFSIENGELKSDSQDAVIKEEKDFTFVFDPKGTKSSLSSSPLNGLYILKDRIITVSNGQEQTYMYSSFAEFPISKKDVQDFAAFVQSIYPIAIFFITLFLFVFNAFVSFIGITLLAFAGTVLGTQTRRKLNYRQTWTLTAYSFTIPTVFFMIMKALNVAVAFHLFVFIFVAFFILYLIIKEIPPMKEKTI
jgi:hypothetical protein